MKIILRNEQYIVCDKQSVCLNENHGGKCWYEEVGKLSRIRRLYVVRIDERINRFRGEQEDNGILMRSGEQ